jgi:Poly(R)-hydroxyalkanoic acid synthase subunit (PHA_synth_III_E)
MTPDSPFPDPDFVRRTLTAFAQQYAGLAASFAPPGAAGGAVFDALRQPMVGAYQRLFTPPGPSPLEAAAVGSAAFVRWQRASERFAGLATAIANDAFARLSRALADNGPGAPPITSLAALHALWIDCGEAAWAEAAHREDFAEAQAELLAALAGLKATASRR